MPEAEKERFKSAGGAEYCGCKRPLRDDMASRIERKKLRILNGHLMLLQDPMLTGEIEESD